jgi:hypothetical protein
LIDDKSFSFCGVVPEIDISQGAQPMLNGYGDKALEPVELRNTKVGLRV